MARSAATVKKTYNLPPDLVRRVKGQVGAMTGSTRLVPSPWLWSEISIAASTGGLGSSPSSMLGVGISGVPCGWLCGLTRLFHSRLSSGYGDDSAHG